MQPLRWFCACWTLALSLCLVPRLQAQAPLDISPDLMTHIDLPNGAGQYGYSITADRNANGVLVGGFALLHVTLPEGSWTLRPATTPSGHPTVRLWTCGPDVTWTQVQAVNRFPAMVGWCYTATATAETLDGFFRSENGTVTRLRFPGARFTEATGINDAPLVVGWYEDQQGGIHGFRWQRSTNQYTSFDVPFPDATATIPVAITNTGDIGVVFATPLESGSALLRQGQWTRLETPGVPDFSLTDVAEDGRLLGLVTRPTGPPQPAIWEGGVVTLLPWPLLDVRAVHVTLSPGNLLVGWTNRDRALPPETPPTSADTISQGFVVKVDALRGEVLGPPPPALLARGQVQAQLMAVPTPVVASTGCPDDGPLRSGRLGMSWVGCARLRGK